MGKKARMKAFRKIAEQLPAMNIDACEKEKVSGAELIKRGITVIKGENGEADEAIDPHEDYEHSTKVAVPVNHKRRIKRLHDQLGSAGIAAYVKYVHDVLEKHSQPKEEPVDADNS